MTQVDIISLYSLIFLQMSTGCASFRAVSATGELGSSVSGHVSAVLTAKELCTLYTSRQTNNASNNEFCKRINDDTIIWSSSLNMLAQYGSTLKKLANANNLEVEENMSSIVESFSSVGWINKDDYPEDRKKLIGEAVQSISDIVTTMYRQREIGTAVKKADPHIQKVSRLILEHLNICKLLVDMMRKDSFGRLQKNTRPEPTGLSQRISYLYRYQIQNEINFLDKVSKRLESARDVVDAFAKSHNHLFKNVDKLGSEDKTLYVEILGLVVKAVSKNLLAAAKP